MLTLARLLQPWKAEYPMLVTALPSWVAGITRTPYAPSLQSITRAVAPLASKVRSETSAPFILNCPTTLRAINTVTWNIAFMNKNIG